MPALPAFRFRPRYRALAWIAIGLGVALLVLAAIGGFGNPVLLVSGLAGVALGGLYLGSPAWRIEILVDDEALEVTASGARRFRLRWDEVVSVTAAPATRTCFVDGGEPARSLLVPGDGASAPYTISDRDGLYAAIMARVPKDRVTTVDLLERATPPAPVPPAS